MIYMTERPTDRTPGSTTRPRHTWAAYAAAVWAGVFAAISLYWALGGMIGLDTVGGEIEKLARAGQGGVLAWGATLLKAAGVVFALALVQRWGRVFPRMLMLVAGWAATAVLIGYGGLTVGGELLVATGAVEAPAGIDWYALHWHLALWDPYFVVWGVLLGIATWQYKRNASPPPRD
jgi:uncharacterized protein DUF3995